jgi:cytochrome c556
MTCSFRSGRLAFFSSLRCLLMAILVVGVGHATIARADGADSDVPEVKYRQTLMSGVGSNMGGIGDILKNGLMLPGHVAAHAKMLAESAQLIAPAFKKNVATEMTDAKPEIWQDWAKFEKAIATFEQAARDMAAAAEGGDGAAIGSAVKALGKSCGGCHKAFRKPKEESYHRKSSDKN